MPTSMEVAWKWLTLGRSVIPSGGGANGKKPLIRWKAFQTKSPDEWLFMKWAQTLSPTVWGVITGPVSGLIGVDCDSAEAVNYFSSLGLEPHVRTIRGAHYHFSYAQTVNSCTRTVEGITFEVKSTGSFMNFCGENSQVSYVPSRAAMSPDGLYDIRELPLELWKDLTTNTNGKLKVSTAGVIEEGLRNMTLTKLATMMAKSGISRDSIEVCLLKENQVKCHPPLSDFEVRGIVKSVMRYAPEVIYDGVTLPGEVFGKIGGAGLSGGEVSVLMAIFDQTHRFHKVEAAIFHPQLESLTGMSRASVFRAVKELKKKDIIAVYQAGQGYERGASRYSIKSPDMWQTKMGSAQRGESQ